MTTYNPKWIDYHDIGNYRQLLMGIGIIGVILGHICNFLFIESGIFYTIAIFLTRFVFTEGFLFLSGYGLYYSFSGNHNILGFYKRRFIRLYEPFFILSFPLYLFYLIIDAGYSGEIFLLQLSSLYFWVGGNYGGMWYVSLSLFLYLLVPSLYYFIYKYNRLSSVIFRFGVVVVFYFSLLLTLKYFCKDYYTIIEIGVDKIVFFLLGFIWGYIVKQNQITNKDYIIILGLIGAVYIVSTLNRIILGNKWGILILCNVSQKLFFMPAICFLMNFFSINRIGLYFGKILEWFGKYSLELYIIHLHLISLANFYPPSFGLPRIILIVFIISITLICCVPVHNIISMVQSRS